MKLHYQVTGPERKNLVKAVSTTLNTSSHYLGAPNFGFEVGGYHIDKNGILEGPDNLDLEDSLHQLGFDAAKREYDEPDSYEKGIGNMDALYSPAVLEVGSAFEEGNTLIVEVPLKGFTDESLENLEKLIASKANLITKAIGATTLPIQRTAATLKFPWFSISASEDEAAAYTLFVYALCEAAKSHKRVTAKEKDVENEKFAFRVFLIRLGFIGDTCKQARKILLKNLTGNSAFRDGSRSAKKEVSEDA